MASRHNKSQQSTRSCNAIVKIVSQHPSRHFVSIYKITWSYEKILDLLPFAKLMETQTANQHRCKKLTFQSYKNRKINTGLFHYTIKYHINNA